jgi:hypothetical protein
VDHLPLMPITMQFAADLAGVRYRDYETDHRVLVESQLRVAEQFGFDYVNTMSDPAREAADCGATVEYFDHTPAALVEDNAVLADKTALASLRCRTRWRRPHDQSASGHCAVQESCAAQVDRRLDQACAEGSDLRASTRSCWISRRPGFARPVRVCRRDGTRFAKEQVAAAWT